MAIKSHGTLNFADDSLVVPNDAGYGLRLGRSDEEGEAWGWRDITAPITVRGVAATDPSWTQVGSSVFYTYAFGVGDYVWQPFHIPHDIAVNRDGSARPIHFHTHWFPSDTDTGYVTFQFDYMYARGFDQEAYDPAFANSPLTNSGTVLVTQQAPGTAYQSMVAETDGVTISTLTEPDGILYVRMGRVANPAASPTLAAYSGTCFVTTNDIHYQSTNMATKQKAPNFYAD